MLKTNNLNSRYTSVNTHEVMKVKNYEGRHAPNLNTIKMVENEFRKNHFFDSKNQLWRSLPKQTQYPTLCNVLDYLEESNKITYDKNGKIVWIFIEGDKAQKSLKNSVTL